MRYSKIHQAIKLNKRETEAYIQRGRESAFNTSLGLKARYEQDDSLNIRLEVADEMIEQGVKTAIGCDGIIYDMAV